MTAVGGYHLSIGSILAQNFGSITSTFNFLLGPKLTKPALFVKIGAVQGTGNLKTSFQTCVENPEVTTPDLVQLGSIGMLTTTSAVSTLLNATVMSNPLLPYGRFTATIESRNSGPTIFFDVVAKLLAEV